MERWNAEGRESRAHLGNNLSPPPFSLSYFISFSGGGGTERKRGKQRAYPKAQAARKYPPNDSQYRDIQIFYYSET
eukprot:356709-Amorphochlora_amoeboformis.AAC.1